MKRVIKVLAIVFCLIAPISLADAKVGNGKGGGHAYGHNGGNGGGRGGGHGAGGGGVPEIDPGMAASAIAFLSCGVAILGSRKKK
jgi:hypothetical protein